MTMYRAVVVSLLLGMAASDDFDWKHCGHGNVTNPLFNITDIRVSPLPLLVPGRAKVTFKGEILRDLLIDEIEIHVRGYRRLPRVIVGAVDCQDMLGCIHTVNCMRQWLSKRVDEDFFGLGRLFSSLVEPLDILDLDPTEDACLFFRGRSFSVRQHTFNLPVTWSKQSYLRTTTYSIRIYAIDKRRQEGLGCINFSVGLKYRPS